MTVSNGWTADELSTIDRTGEVDVATRRRDGTLRAARIAGVVVRHDDAVYVRSVNGTTAAWYRGVQTRHEGELSAGILRRDVAFVEAGEHVGDDDGLDDALDAAYRDQVRPLVERRRRHHGGGRPGDDPACRPRLITRSLKQLTDEKDATWTRTPPPRR